MTAMSNRSAQVGAIAAFVVIFAIGSYGMDMGEVASHWWADMAWTIAALATALRCLATARGQHGAIRSAWGFIGAANLSWFVGMLFWDYQELVLQNPIPFPALSDVGFIMFAPLIMAGLITYRSGTPSVSLTVKQFSELGIILCALILTLVIVFRQPLLELDEPRLYMLTALAYPILYMAAFFLGLSSPFTHPEKNRPLVFGLLLVGIFIHAFSDTLYAFYLLGHDYYIGGFLDVFWLVGFGFIYWAAYEQSVQQPVTAPLHRLLDLQKAEAVLPGAAVGWVIVLVLVFRDTVNSQLLNYIFPVLVIMPLFIVVLSLTENSLQRGLYRDLLASRESLARINEELDARVATRTRELQSAMEEAKQANLAKTEFLSRMSHELRTPMNAVLGFSQLLYHDSALNQDQRDSIREILVAGDHLLCLINDILDLQRIESGRLELEIEEVALSELIDESVALMRSLASREEIQVVVRGSTDGCRARGDRFKLKQVVLNLFSNALKYNRPGGTVTITCEPVGDGSRVRLTVTDTGEGISAEHLEEIFDPFFRVQNMTLVEGTGIGLSVSRKLVEAMNGRIGVESTVGTGSTFWIELDAADRGMSATA